MRVLVTGGLGYVGSRVASHLARYNAVYVSTRSTNRPQPDWLAPGALVPASSLSDPRTLDSLRIEAIVHLGTAGDVVCNSDPALGLHTNGVETEMLLACAIAAGVKRFVYFSTVHVYCTPLIGELEESIAARPSTPYSLAHRAGEIATLAVRATGDIEAIVVRLSNAFGPPGIKGAERWHLLANDICRQAVLQRRLTLNTPGYQMRNFVPLPDVAQAVELLLSSPYDRRDNGVFNLAGSKSLRVLEFAELIAQQTERILGFKPVIVRPEAPFVESPPLHISTSKLSRVGFAHRTSLTEEIGRTIEHCLKSHSENCDYSHVSYTKP
jgi:UDP-glucose 4-epimerase